MAKYLVETYYTCTFKIVHDLNELDEKNLSEIDNRQDGKVEIMDVTINNRKTKKLNGEHQKTDKFKLSNELKIDHNATYVNIGDWITHNTYAVLEKGVLHIKKY